MDQKTLDIILTRLESILCHRTATIKEFAKGKDDLASQVSHLNFEVWEYQHLLDDLYEYKRYFTCLTDNSTGIEYFGYYLNENNQYFALCMNEPKKNHYWCRLPEEKPITAKYAC